MIVNIEDITSLIESIESHPISMNERDFLGNIWNALTRDKPTITQKQYNYLKSLASRTVTAKDVEITNGSTG